MTADDVGADDAALRALAEVERRIEAWIRHGEAVPADVTTYDRWIVHDELRQIVPDARAALAAVPRPVTQTEDCGHPNHGGADHDCAPFLPCTGPSCACHHQDVTPSQPAHGEALTDREALGRQVREVWVQWATEQDDPKPSWLVPWEGLSERDREVDRRIGEELYAEGRRSRMPSSAEWAAFHDRLQANPEFVAAVAALQSPTHAAQPAHGDNEAALRALAEVESRMELSVFPMPPAVPLRADNGYLSYATMLHHLADLRAALSASAEPEGLS